MNKREIITAALAFWIFISEKEGANLNEAINVELSEYAAENPLT